MSSQNKIKSARLQKALINPSVAPNRGSEDALYVEWKRHGRHLKEYASKFIGTAFLLLCVVAVVGLMFASSSPLVKIMPSTRLQG